jgi:hypothetical protein
MALNDGKWHQITFVYQSGTVFLYVDGVLDKSVQNINPPTPNYNHFSIGALFIDKNNIINPFLGDIDEVYVWDLGLTEGQIRYLMTQEIERFDNSGTDYVNGKILPQAATSNEAASLLWSSLRGYYDFNSFYGSTIEGLADNRLFLRLKYLNKNKSVVCSQSIPVPYVSVVDGEWGNGNIWSNSSVQNVPNAMSLNGVTKIDWDIVETSHNITSGDRDIKVLALKNISGTITIANPNETLDETNTGHNLTVTHYLELDGVIDLVGESQLIQEEGSILDADSGGYLYRDQQGTANSYNYNYWTSSVGPIAGNTATRGTGVSSTNTNYTISGVLLDGTNSSSPSSVNFGSSKSWADGGVTNPLRLSSYWMYKFYGPSNDYNAWVKINQSSSLLPGEGFTMKGTSGASTISDQQNYVFKGLPYNGDITLALDKSAGDVERLIGNPYPSAISAYDFILDNLSEAAGGNNTVNVINGTLYFWDHFGEENSHNLGNYVGGYATYNLTGSVKAIANDNRINNDLSFSSKVPGPYIPVNQGFFVSTLGVVGGNIFFKNSQRVFESEAPNKSVFLRQAGKNNNNNKNNSKTANSNPIIRLLYDSPLGYHRQIAVGQDVNATNGIDLGYDSYIIDINEEDMYWIIENDKFVIQGVNNFGVTQEFPLGLIVKTAGLIKINLDGLENIDPNTPLFIKDNTTGQTFQINASPFEINLPTGTYDGRFMLVFQPSSPLSINDDSVDDGIKVFYNSEKSELNINLTMDFEVNNATVFNLLGQKIKSIGINSRNTVLPLKVNAGVYILQFNTARGEIGKKIIIH